MSSNEQKPKLRLSAVELMRLPFEERNRIAIEALESSQDLDLECLDPFDKCDFDDEDT